MSEYYYSQMKSFLHIISLFVITFNSVVSLYHSSLERKVKIVSGYHSANFVYQRTRVINGQSYPKIDEELHDKIKQLMCDYIMGNIFFIYRGMQPYHRSVLDKLPSRTNPEIITSNENTIINVSFYATPVSRTIEESVFICERQTIGLAGLTSEVEKYYVSNEYNMSDRSDSYISGRFLFSHDGNKRILLRGVAEEPASIAFGVGFELEEHYLQIRGKNEPASSVDKDPLCKVDVDVKVRICAAVFNSPHFRDEELSFARLEVDGSCQKETISFRTRAGEINVVGKQFDEWLMHCEPLQNDMPFHYFISQAYELEKVFVYFWDKYEKKFFLENLSVKVRLRDDGFAYNYF